MNLYPAAWIRTDVFDIEAKQVAFAIQRVDTITIKGRGVHCAAFMGTIPNLAGIGMLPELFATLLIESDGVTALSADDADELVAVDERRLALEAENAALRDEVARLRAALLATPSAASAVVAHPLKTK